MTHTHTELVRSARPRTLLSTSMYAIPYQACMAICHSCGCLCFLGTKVPRVSAGMLLTLRRCRRNSASPPEPWPEVGVLCQPDSTEFPSYALCSCPPCSSSQRAQHFAGAKHPPCTLPTAHPHIPPAISNIGDSLVDRQRSVSR